MSNNNAAINELEHQDIIYDDPINIVQDEKDEQIENDTLRRSISTSI